MLQRIVHLGGFDKCMKYATSGAGSLCFVTRESTGATPSFDTTSTLKLSAIALLYICRDGLKASGG
jgi:hypothetical protein